MTRYRSRLLSFLTILSAISAGPGPARAADICPALPPSPPGLMDTQPVPLDDPLWRDRAAQLDRQVASTDMSRVRVVFLGDSITEGWEPVIFQHFNGNRNALNLGVRGDRTANMLWRLPHYPFGSSLRPQLIVLLTGTNNLWPGARPEDPAQGVVEIMRTLHQRSPNSRILLIGLLPRGQTPSDPLRQVAARVNQVLARCADNRTVFYVDPGPLLLDANGMLSNQISGDFLHPTWLGYAILSTAIEPAIRQLVGR